MKSDLRLPVGIIQKILEIIRSYYRSYWPLKKMFSCHWSRRTRFFPSLTTVIRLLFVLTWDESLFWSISALSTGGRKKVGYISVELQRLRHSTEKKRFRGGEEELQRFYVPASVAYLNQHKTPRFQSNQETNKKQKKEKQLNSTQPNGNFQTNYYSIQYRVI